MKIHTTIAGVLCLVALTTGGCVMSSTYGEAVADLEATKAELDSTRIQSQALTEQIHELQQLKAEFVAHMEAVSSTLMEAKQRMKAERMASQERLGKLTRAISRLTIQQSRLLDALQRANAERPGLQSIIEKYQFKQGEIGGPRVAPSSQPIPQTNEPAAAALAPPAPIDPALPPTVTTPAAPADPATINPKPQAANEQPSESAEKNDWLSMIKGWVLSLWQSIFL
jgi:hypothetical protein